MLFRSAIKAGNLCDEYKGVCPADSEIKFENLESVFERAKNAILRYPEYKKIIVVTHGMLMRCFWFEDKIPFCGISEIDFDESFAYTGYKAL